MNDAFQDYILRVTGATSLYKVADIQSLWSGYGSISRFGLKGSRHKTIVVKQVIPPINRAHPRGWNTSISHQRKIRSYEAESAWYKTYSALCDTGCRVAGCLGLEASADEFLMVLEDLDASGYPVRKTSVTLAEMHTCLRWLAHFHGTFMGQLPEGLWPVGTYWHLATRPDELEVLEDPALKAAATQIDQLLQACPYQTLVHGDAKLANFCFSKDGQRVAGVDFQYVGGGCGMKDVAYFMGSCLNETDCERYEQALLNVYFAELRRVLVSKKVAVDPQAVESAWRPLFPLAWTDFHRFLKGWSPGHWKINDYSERVARQVLSQLDLT